MSKILAMPDGNWLSHVSRPLEIAKQLREMGHEVVFSGTGEYLELARQAEFAVRPSFCLGRDHVLRCSRSGRANWWSYELIERGVSSDLEAIEAEKPDLVLGDFQLTLSTSCSLATVPYASILNASWTNYYSAKQRAPEHLAVTRILGRALTTALMPIVKHSILSADARPFRKFRRKHGLQHDNLNMFDIWRGDLNLLVDTPEYGPCDGLPASFHYIGPIVWEPDIALPEWYDEIDARRPTVYFTMGSTGFAKFFHQAVDIFGDTEIQGVMTTAGMSHLDAVPSNFFVTEYAPGSAIMKKSDVVVCQGGNGTIYQALRAGVPIVGVPTMHDQEFNLDRVVELGAGVHLSELRFQPEHLRSAVHRVLEDGSFAAGARRQADVLASYDGPRRGAEIIDRYLERTG